MSSVILGDAAVRSQDDSILLLSSVATVIITDSDTLTIGITEGESLSKHVFKSDTDELIIGITEGESIVATTLFVVKTDSDTLTLSIVEVESLLKHVSKSDTDTLILGITDLESIITTSSETTETYLRRYLNDV